MALAALGVSSCKEQSTQAPAEAPVEFQRTSNELAVHGARLADVLGCTGCHGADLVGEDWSEPGFGRLWTANLTRAVPGYSDEQLAQVIRSGANPERELWEMPSHIFTQLTRNDMAALIAFLRSKPPAGEVRPEPLFGEGAKREIEAGSFQSSQAQVKASGTKWPPDMGKEHALARYMVRATCAECHGLNLRGGQPSSTATPRPDLRIAAAYEPAAFRRLLRTGIAAGDRDVGLMSKVARFRYRHFTDSEVDAIHRYLKRVAEEAP
jgi:mono/diheme cytochrome c family protein